MTRKIREGWSAADKEAGESEQIAGTQSSKKSGTRPLRFFRLVIGILLYEVLFFWCAYEEDAAQNAGHVRSKPLSMPSNTPRWHERENIGVIQVCQRKGLEEV